VFAEVKSKIRSSEILKKFKGIITLTASGPPRGKSGAGYRTVRIASEIIKRFIKGCKGNMILFMFCLKGRLLKPP
jgi:hypothetical protein